MDLITKLKLTVADLTIVQKDLIEQLQQYALKLKALEEENTKLNTTVARQEVRLARYQDAETENAPPLDAQTP